MRLRILIMTMLLPGAVAMPQSAASPAANSPVTQMRTPPPVSVKSYPTAVGAKMRSNYLHGGISYSTSYVDNYYPGTGGAPLSETTLTTRPTMELDLARARYDLKTTYAGGYTFYLPSSALNEIDHTATVDYGLRLSRHTMITAVDSFSDGSPMLSGTNADLNGSVSGEPVTSTPGAIPPFAKRLSNSINAQISFQPGLNVMIGASGMSSILHYPQAVQANGLGDSNSRGGTAFYDRRLSGNQYFGVTYQYMDTDTAVTGIQSNTTTSSVMAFYTVYLSRRLSLSASGGPEHFNMTYASEPPITGLAPSVTVSMGWQGSRTVFSTSYSQSVTGGGGLFGAYHSTSGTTSMRWQASRTWQAGLSGGYADNKSVGGIFSMGSQNGHSIMGSASVQHTLRGQLSVSVGYDRMHQSYAGVTAISTNPDSNRESISINWNFVRPLGR